MNEKISTLMDGELDRDAAMMAIKHLGQDNGRRETWDQYHLIGEVLRGESSGEIARRKKSADAIFARLADEPTVLVPAAMKVVPVQKKTRMALAMAASIVTVSAIAVVALKQQSGVVAPVQTVQQMELQPIMQVSGQSTANTRGFVQNSAADTRLANQTGAATPAEVRVNDYLAIHRQFSNHQDFRAASVEVAEPPRAAAK
jgi:sigma-E factor negative regulatory protein RseA